VISAGLARALKDNGMDLTLMAIHGWSHVAQSHSIWA
jgi:hypothetical protein